MSEILINREFLFTLNDIEEIIEENCTLKCIFDLFKLCTREINKNPDELDLETVERLISLSDSIVERQWEILNTGSWSCVEQNEKQIYGLAIYFKVTLCLLKPKHTAAEIQTHLSDLDHAIIKGAYLRHANTNILRLMAEKLNLHLYNLMDRSQLESINLIKINESLIPDPRYCQYKLDILQEPPSIEKFMRHYFHPQKPCIIKNYIAQNWEACEKWKDIDYLIKVCGHRLVPVEIGSSYADDNWKQQLILFKDFLAELTADDKPDGHNDEIKYLAQHNLFEQIVELQNDFTIPEYCYITNSDDIDIKSWFGPKDTKTPLHYDNKQNLLCQVFGYKRVILISPADSKFIDCYDTLLLNNTCTIDFDDLNYADLNPNLANCKICEFILKPGDMLFIPYKWWHYVKSLSTSFSVSFWWE